MFVPLRGDVGTPAFAYGFGALSPSYDSAVRCARNFVPRPAFAFRHTYQEDIMGRGLLLWLIGIPLPIILIIWLLGGLHG
jgi:hypothetical protein